MYLSWVVRYVKRRSGGRRGGEVIKEDEEMSPHLLIMAKLLSWLLSTHTHTYT